MASAFRSLLILSALLLLGCDSIAGGGGSVNVPPDVIAYGEPTPLRLELSVWGAGSGKMTKRYTDVRCCYRVERAGTFTALEGKVESEAKDRMVIIFELPGFTAKDGSYVEYYFDMKFDGHYNTLSVERVPLR